MTPPAAGDSAGQHAAPASGCHYGIWNDRKSKAEFRQRARGREPACQAERNPRPGHIDMKNLAVFDPFLHCTVWSQKKTDSESGPDFRLTRSRHPSASGRRIGPSPGDGWAARRDPQANSGVFYWAGL